MKPQLTEKFATALGISADRIALSAAAATELEAEQVLLQADSLRLDVTIKPPSPNDSGQKSAAKATRELVADGMAKLTTSINDVVPEAQVDSASVKRVDLASQNKQESYSGQRQGTHDSSGRDGRTIAAIATVSVIAVIGLALAVYIRRKKLAHAEKHADFDYAALTKGRADAKLLEEQQRKGPEVLI